MRTLRIESTRLFLDGEPIDLSKLEDKSEFISSLMLVDIEIAESVLVSDIIHLFYDSKKIISSILSEEYEVVRALVTSSVLSNKYKALKVYKSFKVERESVENDKEFVYMSTEIKLIPSDLEDGVNLVSNLPILIDESIEIEYNGVSVNSNIKITLLDLMTALFDELPSLFRQGNLFYSEDYF